jgi:hypothetical protein
MTVLNTCNIVKLFYFLFENNKINNFSQTMCHIACLLLIHKMNYNVQLTQLTELEKNYNKINERELLNNVFVFIIIIIISYHSLEVLCRKAFVIKVPLMYFDSSSSSAIGDLLCLHFDKSTVLLHDVTTLCLNVLDMKP